MLAAINMLDEVIPEFRGTGAELQLLQPLLYALKQESLYDRWLDVYLDALYRHPTHEMVGDLAEEAAAISRAVSRENEVATGFRYVSGVPLNFLAKSQLERSLVRVRNGFKVAADHHEQQL